MSDRRRFTHTELSRWLRIRPNTLTVEANRAGLRAIGHNVDRRLGEHLRSQGEAAVLTAILDFRAAFGSCPSGISKEIASHANRLDNITLDDGMSIDLTSSRANVEISIGLRIPPDELGSMW